MNSRTIAVSSLRQDVRDQFIRRTYAHLFGAIAAFTALEFYLFSSGLAGQILSMMSGLNWLWILGGFVVFSWMATHFARSTSSKGMQYFGLGLFVVAEAIIFVPLLAMAQQQAGGQVIESAALATMMGFTGLTTIAFFTRADFSWMGKILMFGGIGALVLIVCGALFGFQLGVFFSVGMVLLAGMSILYDTSNVIHHYSEDDYVAASLQLFASVAMMFYYILRIFSSRD